MEKLDFAPICAQNSTLMSDFKPLFFFLKAEFLQKILDLPQELFEMLKLSRDFLETVLKNDKRYEKSPCKNQTSLTRIQIPQVVSELFLNQNKVTGLWMNQDMSLQSMCGEATKFLIQAKSFQTG